MKSSYPIAVKVYLKAVPAAVMTLLLMVALPVLGFHMQYYRMEGLPKGSGNCSNFERMLRLRDEKYRHVYHHYLTRQPKDALEGSMFLD